MPCNHDQNENLPAGWVCDVCGEVKQAQVLRGRTFNRVGSTETITFPPGNLIIMTRLGSYDLPFILGEVNRGEWVELASSVCWNVDRPLLRRRCLCGIRIETTANQCLRPRGHAGFHIANNGDDRPDIEWANMNPNHIPMLGDPEVFMVIA